jgi:2-C-methyl-D-erythritol 4-phosphate cytidylyltransferase
VTVGAVVPAAGMGTRLGGSGPKALEAVAGQALLVHAIQSLRACSSVGPVVVAVPVGRRTEVEALLVPYDVTVVEGGVERQDSVVAALAALPDGVTHVLVHDAARAFVPLHVVAAVVEALHTGVEAVVPVLPVADTIKRVDANGAVLATVPREDLRAAQTPQGFAREVLERAHASGRPATDDASLVEALGVTVQTVPGAAEAFKVTTPFDLLVAEALVTRRG